MVIAAEEFKTAMAQLAGAVTVVAAGEGHSRTGLTATAVCSLTAEPPRVLACVGKATGLGSLVRVGDGFSVNVLGRDQQEISEVFAGFSDLSGEQRFSSGTWESLVTGAPVLAGTRVSLDCRAVELIDQSSHFILIGEIEATLLGGNASGPLLYADRQFCGIDI